jgi:acyl-CoA thioesterase I
MPSRSRLLVPLAIGLLAGVLACSRQAPADAPPAESAAERLPAAAAPNTNAPRIVFLGDSLTAGLGVAPSEAYPALIQERVREAGYDFEVVNAGVSGDTSAGGLRRLDWSIEGTVRVLVVALGANDGLRGLPATEMQQNLATIIERAQNRRIEVVLAGMEAPPNFGPEYTRQFRAVYADLARTYHVHFIPFFLDGVAGMSSLNQGDGIHPNAQGHRAVADLVWHTLQPVLAARATQ